MVFLLGSPLTALSQSDQTVFDPVVLRPIDEAGAIESDPFDTEGAIEPQVVGNLQTRPLVADSERKAWLFDGGTRIEFADQEGLASLDADQGEEIFLAAWVQLTEIGAGQNVYLIGKGRTKAGAVNQNYALRLRGGSGNDGAAPSFLFRSRGENSGWHRWTANGRVHPGSGWHHVAVGYRFGEPDSLVCWLDGIAIDGTWDMDGASAAPPVVDDDAVWIGSSMAGNRSCSLRGHLTDVVIARQFPSEEELAELLVVQPVLETYQPSAVPQGVVRMEVFEQMPSVKTFGFLPGPPHSAIDLPAFAAPRLPTPYDQRGERTQYAGPILITMRGEVALPAGPVRLLTRGLPGCRLLIDGEVVLKVEGRPTGGFDRVPPTPPSYDSPLTRHLRPGDSEGQADWESDGQPHPFEVQWLIGGNRRLELGEGIVAWRPRGAREEPFQLLAPEADIALTDFAWRQYADEVETELAAYDRQRRREGLAHADDYWQRRHAAARRWAEQQLEERGLAVDAQARQLIDDRYAERNATETESLDDLTFLRRLTLDLAGRIPTVAEIDAYLQASSETRREEAITRLIDADSFADSLMPGWLDVLAENPNLLNPTLNNTGPFRHFLHEAFLDRQPIDRIVTRMILQGGAERYGGPAGFGVASQNDVPAAARAIVLAKAFLGREMSCARCHDAPFHETKQAGLFSLAAMLRPGNIKVPATSSLPADPEFQARMAVEVTLKPGESVAAEWPLPQFVEESQIAEWIRDPHDERERLAALVTAHPNLQFARVVANRMWYHYMGWGLTDDLDDWELGPPNDPELLDQLAILLIRDDYDIRRLAGEIVRSELYAQPRAAESDAHGAAPRTGLFTAEQVVDSLFAAVGKPLARAELNFDDDASRPVSNSINLGVPRRAWQMIGLSNERDRSTLSLPRAQAIIDLMERFGWRPVRQVPMTREEPDQNPLMAASLQNSIIVDQAVRLTPDSAITRVALDEQATLAEFVDHCFLATLGRRPNESERELAVQLLQPGFGERLVRPAASSRDGEALPRVAVSWSHHLHPVAAEIQREAETVAQTGRPATDRIDPDWRTRAEDLMWSLVNSPEMIMLP